MNQLHPGARWIFRLNAYSRFGGLFFVFVYFFVFAFLDKSKYSWVRTILGDSLVVTFFSVFLATSIG